MKKLTALLLALVMVLSLAACGAKETTPETKAPEAAAPVETKAPVEEAPAAPTSLNIYGIYKSESPYFVNEAASIEKALNDKGAEYGIEMPSLPASPTRPCPRLSSPSARLPVS